MTGYFSRLANRFAGRHDQASKLGLRVSSERSGESTIMNSGFQGEVSTETTTPIKAPQTSSEKNASSAKVDPPAGEWTPQPAIGDNLSPLRDKAPKGLSAFISKIFPKEVRGKRDLEKQISPGKHETSSFISKILPKEGRGKRDLEKQISPGKHENSSRKSRFSGKSTSSPASSQAETISKQAQVKTHTRNPVRIDRSISKSHLEKPALQKEIRKHAQTFQEEKNKPLSKALFFKNPDKQKSTEISKASSALESLRPEPSHFRGNRGPTNSGESGKPGPQIENSSVNIRIGAISLEVHQSSKSTPQPAPQIRAPKPGVDSIFKSINLNRYYIRNF